MWAYNETFYQIYPIGFCGAPVHNDGVCVPRIRKLMDWSEYLQTLGVDSILLNPIFESDNHGYDTRDFKKIDCRLGTNEDFKEVCEDLHKHNVKIVLDGVFNHVGRGFWAFKDVQEKKWDSPYKDWFHISFDGNSCYDDGFWYEGWEGHFELVKLNLQNPAVVDYLMECVKYWIDEFNIDGLRLDVAYSLDHNFMRRLRSYTQELKPDFALIGEVLFGDYNIIVNDEMLHSCTNYECYKGLYSSFNSMNMFEIVHSLLRQFGPENWTLYKGKHLLSFVDNHDVNRLASTLCDQRYLPLCYTLMYCMPGIPSVYYGSEYGVMGRHENNSDDGLRPCLDLDDLNRSGNLDLYRHLVKLGRIYHAYPALRTGSYYTVEVRNRQLLFAKEQDGRTVYVALNLEDCPSEFRFGTHVPSLVDVISGQPVQVENGGAWIRMAPFSSMILVEDDIVNQTEPEAAAVAVPEPTVLEAGAKYRDVLDGSVCELLQTSVRHAETQEELVVYRKEQDGSVWAMPKLIFTGTAHDNQPRFEKL